MRRLGGSNRSHERVRCSPVGVGDDAATNEQLQVTWLWSGSALPPIATDLGTPHIGSSVPEPDSRSGCEAIFVSFYASPLRTRGV